MKLQTIIHHHYEGLYRPVDSIYFSDKEHGERMVRRGICSEIEMPTRADKMAEKKETKMEPKVKVTRKKKN
jgi:hypothetical protein